MSAMQNMRWKARLLLPIRHQVMPAACPFHVGKPLMFELISDQGLLRLPLCGFHGGVVRFTFDHLSVASDQLDWKGTTTHGIASRDGIEFHIHTDSQGIRVLVRNTDSKPVRLKEITIEFAPDRLAAAPSAHDYMEYIHAAEFEQTCGTKRVGLPNRWMSAGVSSHMVYVLYHRTNRQAWLWSTLPPHAGDYVSFRALHEAPHLQGRFGIMIRCEIMATVLPGKDAATSTIQCRSGSDPLTLLNDVGKQWLGARSSPLKDTRLGWNSWDYFAGAVTSADVLQNAAMVRNVLAIKTPDIVIDDGWQMRWGSWIPNDNFAEGLDWLCHQIVRDGGIPGIWTAPLMVNCFSHLYQDHPDWFVRDGRGDIVNLRVSNGNCAVLDITHAQVRQLIREIFTRLKSHGFRTFKVDFTQMILKGDRFSDSTVPRGQLLRMTFQTIREAIGQESYLLACGAPYESVTGIVDAVRITGDVAIFWSHVLRDLSCIASRWWMHRALWNNDPDFLVVRSPEHSPNHSLGRQRHFKPADLGDWWWSGRQFNAREARTYAFLVLLSAGDILLSDHLPLLNDTGIEILRKVVNHRLSRAAVPLDLFDSHEGLPSVWLADEPTFQLIGLFNWEEDPRDFRLDLAQMGIPLPAQASSLWDNRPIPIDGASVQIRLEPRDCLGLYIPRAKPR